MDEMKVILEHECTNCEGTNYRRSDNDVLYSDPLRVNADCVYCGKRNYIEYSKWLEN